MKPFLAGAVMWALAGTVLAGPEELPPPDYAGLQYVDSKGCLFLRAGQNGDGVWLPRVTRDGQPICDYPPSGKRVPVAEDSPADP